MSDLVNKSTEEITTHSTPTPVEPAKEKGELEDSDLEHVSGGVRYVAEL